MIAKLHLMLLLCSSRVVISVFAFLSVWKCFSANEINEDSQHVSCLDFKATHLMLNSADLCDTINLQQQATLMPNKCSINGTS